MPMTNASAIPKGKPLGSFENWAEWCRDPLLALGCCDPVERIEALKANDPWRKRVVELFGAWWEHHHGDRVAVSQLADPVKVIADPQDRVRQYLAGLNAGKVGTNAGGFVLTRHVGQGRWSTATYVLKRTPTSEVIGHGDRRGHRGHTADPTTSELPAPAPDDAPGDGVPPMTPMIPMPCASDDAVPPGAKATI